MWYSVGTICEISLYFYKHLSRSLQAQDSFFPVTVKIWNHQGGTGLKLSWAEMTRLFKVNMTRSITYIPEPQPQKHNDLGNVNG